MINHKNFTYKALIDWIEIEITTTTPTNHWTLRAKADLCYVEALNESSGAAATIFKFRVYDIATWAQLNKTIDNRKAEIPKALLIINDTINEVKEWYILQQNNPVLRKIKSQLNELNVENTSLAYKEKIHKTVSTLAIQLKKENNKGCQYIHALNNHLHPDYEANS